ncbi:MAG: hypothetical protein E2O80_07365 [Betaproteobacteria bacterium]|nr:MAG: hypothetical protein E2O80_07365 [Betaproteobacteria bacterium]
MVRIDQALWPSSGADQYLTPPPNNTRHVLLKVLIDTQDNRLLTAWILVQNEYIVEIKINAILMVITQTRIMLSHVACMVHDDFISFLNFRARK